MSRVLAAALVCLATMQAAPLRAEPSLGAAPAKAAAPSARSSGARLYNFAFNDADIPQVADEVLGTALGLQYTIDASVSGKMSFRIDQRLTRAQLLAAFEAALAAYDVVIVRGGGDVVLTSRTRARADTAVSTPDRRRGDGYEVIALPLAFATPSEITKVLQATGSGELVIFTDDKMGLMLLGGAGRELTLALDTIKIFDRSGLEASRLRYFPLDRAPAATVAQELERLFSSGGATGAVFVPLKRLNAIVVIGRTPSILDEAGAWITRLDASSREEATSLWIYRPRNLTAESLGATLNTVVAGQVRLGSVDATAGISSDAAASEPVQNSAVVASSSQDQVRIGVDKESNTLIVSAPKSRWTEIVRILEEIDRTPNQVLIEASILEVTLTNEFRFGVDWTTIASGGKLRIGVVGNQTGTVASRFPGVSVTFFDDDIRAAVSALGARTNVEVISNPKVMALDNRTAKLQIGDQVPVATQVARDTTAADAPLIVSTEYRNTGVILEVTPRINGGDTIVLDVSQEVSSVARTTSSGIDSPTIQQRRMQSVLILPDGGTVALGGLISSTRTQGDTGVPFLKDIPGLGSVFKNDSRESRRTELIVLLTARVVEGSDTSPSTVANLLADMREITARGMLSN